MAASLGISEGKVRNLILYADLADLCAGREGMPTEDEIAAMGIREVRRLIAQLEGNGDEAKPAASPKDAADEPSELRLLKHHWNRSSEEIRAAFLAWVG